MMNTIRRIVTGHDAHGQAVIASDGPLPTVVELAAIPGTVFHEVWSTEGSPAPVGNGPDPTVGPLRLPPPRQGTRIRFVDIPPDTEEFLKHGGERMRDAFAEIGDASASTYVRQSPHPLMHRTESIDYGIVISGEMTLVLDKGETLLRAGAVVVALGLSLAACGVNTITTLEETAKARWADVENQYQRRSDLIPNLVSTVQGYAKQEKDVLVAVTEARAKATSIHIDAGDLTDPAKVKALQDAQGALTGALSRLLAVSENYPDLKSNANFLSLQAQLEGTENRIAVARKDYIAAVQAYNIELRTFPGVLWASTAFRSNKPMAEFAATEEAQTAPKVKF